MSILFSPVGTADPLTQLGDGPMLHLVRHLNPDKVVLFLSKKMMGHQRDDRRYTKAIELLSKDLGREVPQIELVESANDDVFKFDTYISEFEDILKQLSSRASETKDTILVNTTSGTPAMSQALVALGSFGRLDLEMFQVITPRKDANHPCDREDSDDYDFDTLWELNVENEENDISRILPVHTPNFSERLLRENVVKLVEAYEYEAAYILCSNAPGISECTVEMIRAAADRLNLDGQLPSKVFGGTELKFSPNDLLGEYLYTMEVRLDQGHWADFVRSLSPALTEIMKRGLSSRVPERSYNLYECGRPTDRYNLEGIRGDKRLSKLFPDSYIVGRDKYGKECGKYITNDSYWKLVQEYCDDDDRVKKIGVLREAERKGRNPLVHEVIASPKASIEEKCGMPLETIMQYLFELYSAARPGLYRRITAEIVRSIE